MSVVFLPERVRGKAEVNQETLRRLMDENDQLIRCIVEYQNKGGLPNAFSSSTSFIGTSFTWRRSQTLLLRPTPKRPQQKDKTVFLGSVLAYGFSPPFQMNGVYKQCTIASSFATPCYFRD